jgi:hypothetical protein
MLASTKLVLLLCSAVGPVPRSNTNEVPQGFGRALRVPMPLGSAILLAALPAAPAGRWAQTCISTSHSSDAACPHHAALTTGCAPCTLCTCATQELPAPAPCACSRALCGCTGREQPSLTLTTPACRFLKTNTTDEGWSADELSGTLNAKVCACAMGSYWSVVCVLPRRSTPGCGSAQAVNIRAARASGRVSVPAAVAVLPACIAALTPALHLLCTGFL